jgi:Ser/Thr protein kinase RdoA (MazF antagonist)
MNNEIKACFSKQVISLCARCHGFTLGDLTLLGSWQNFVYSGKKNGMEYILRITHSSHRSEQQIQDELDFILYVTRNGLNASIPLPSLEGRLIETITQGKDQFFAVCFKKAIGKAWEFTESSIYQIGVMTGLLHALSRQYKKDVRYHWYDNGYILEHKLYIPEKYKQVIENAAVLMGEIKDLPVNRRNYGLVHGDLHGNNYFVDDNGIITIFDFDECQLDWYADDIVIQLFYYTYVFENVYDRADFFLKHFLRGYRQHSDIAKEDVELMPWLFRLRELIVFTGACRGFNIDKLDPYTQRFVDRLSLMGRPLYIDVEKLNFDQK